MGRLHPQVQLLVVEHTEARKLRLAIAHKHIRVSWVLTQACDLVGDWSVHSRQACGLGIA